MTDAIVDIMQSLSIIVLGLALIIHILGSR